MGPSIIVTSLVMVFIIGVFGSLSIFIILFFIVLDGHIIIGAFGSLSIFIVILFAVLGGSIIGIIIGVFGSLSIFVFFTVLGGSTPRLVIGPIYVMFVPMGPHHINLP